MRAREPERRPEYAALAKELGYTLQSDSSGEDAVKLGLSTLERLEKEELHFRKMHAESVARVSKIRFALACVGECPFELFEPRPSAQVKGDER